MSRVTTAFFTQAHRIAGQLTVTERLSEKLNDPLTDFIELTDVRISSLLKSDNAPSVIWPMAAIPKKVILLATLDMQEHESRQTRIDKVQAKKGSEVGAVVGTIEVYGTGHLQFDGAPTRVLTSQLQPFFPITDATILLSQREIDSRMSTGLALVNRELIQAFTLG